MKRVTKSESQATKDEKSKKPKVVDEVMNLRCEWNGCDVHHDSWEKLDCHLMAHIDDESESLKCRWTNCDHEATASQLLKQHLSHHGYIAKLTNIGKKLVKRNDLPECRQKKIINIPTVECGYACSWEDCTNTFWTIFGFITHLDGHLSDATRVKNDSEKKILRCCCRGCFLVFSVKAKLKEHLRTHSKEKIIGCPSCFLSFSNNTKFSDHRKRQQIDSEVFQCPECQKAFGNERLLRDHARSHEKLHKCPLCEVRVSRLSHIAEHMRYKHPDFKPFICQVCKKMLVTRSNLQSHFKIHRKCTVEI